MDRAVLHQLVDSLPESEVYAAGKYLEDLNRGPEEVKLSTEELQAVDEGLAGLERGQWVSHEQMGRRLQQWTQG